jgi:N-acetylneuraminic acid mutarotase
MRTLARRMSVIGLAVLLLPACSSDSGSGEEVFPSFVTATTFPPAAPAGQWSWRAGADLHNEPGVYGVQGAPDAANTPGARMAPVYWSDALGGLWLFGGRSWDENGVFGDLNDLWRWDGAAWTWIMGSRAVGTAAGSYGTKGVRALSNIPPGRDLAASCVDARQRVWLYGGNGVGGTLGDLWRFDGATWVWLSGQAPPSPVPSHGTLGVAGPGNTPGGREQSTAWIDAAGRFWLFGGVGYDEEGGYGRLGDLWMFDGSAWTWMKGPKVVNQTAVYGVQGVAAAANRPGGRSVCRGYTDAAGNLWLFGGAGFDSVGTNFFLNDLWKFDGANWTWMKGGNLAGADGVYGTKGVAAAANTPGARFIHASTTDANGHFWVLGGDAGSLGYVNDVWRFDGTNWTWMAGESTGFQACVYGTKGASSASSTPGSRGHASMWFDPAGQLWVFGGEGFTDVLVLQLLNDLWRYSP